MVAEQATKSKRKTFSDVDVIFWILRTFDKAGGCRDGGAIGGGKVVSDSEASDHSGARSTCPGLRIFCDSRGFSP